VLLLQVVTRVELRRVGRQREDLLLGDEASGFRECGRRVLLVVDEARPGDLDALDLVGVVEALDARFGGSAGVGELGADTDAREFQRGAVETPDLPGCSRPAARPHQRGDGQCGHESTPDQGAGAPAGCPHVPPLSSPGERRY